MGKWGVSLRIPGPATCATIGVRLTLTAIDTVARVINAGKSLMQMSHCQMLLC